MPVANLRERNRVAIIGAGISGLACAQKLTAEGCVVSVFEKSRGVGGRMAVRRLSDGVAFDHGAQYFTARDPRFRRQVDAWVAGGHAAVWDGRIVRLEHGRVEAKDDSTTRFVGIPAMNAVCKSLAAGLRVESGTRVGSVERCGDRWSLSDTDGRSLGVFDYVLSSAPPPQTVELFAICPAIAKGASSIEMQACWSVLLTFEKTLKLTFDGAFVHSSPLSWIARNSSKPSRVTVPESWLIHASSDWSDAHLESDPNSVLTSLLAAFWEATGARTVEPTFRIAHRWRFSIPVEPLRRRCLFEEDVCLGACGDWCGGPRVEGAYLSGLALADNLLDCRNDLGYTVSVS